MGVYDRQIAATERQIKAKGASVTWRKTIGVITDAEKPWSITPAVESFTDYPNTYLLFLPVGRVGKESSRFGEESEVAKSSIKGFLAGNVAFIPEIGDVILHSGKEMKVANVNTIAPNGENIFHTIEFEQ